MKNNIFKAVIRAFPTVFKLLAVMEFYWVLRRENI
jgi:hypothetical protein